jgi:hypothetical protein
MKCDDGDSADSDITDSESVLSEFEDIGSSEDDEDNGVENIHKDALRHFGRTDSGSDSSQSTDGSITDENEDDCANKGGGADVSGADDQCSEDECGAAANGSDENDEPPSKIPRKSGETLGQQLQHENAVYICIDIEVSNTKRGIIIFICPLYDV